jgi:hypothetical protein
MAERGKQTKVGVRQRLAYRPVKLVCLANDNRYEVELSNAFFCGKAIFIYNIALSQWCPNSDIIIDTNSYL